MDLVFKTAHELGDMLKNREISAVELTEIFNKRIADTDDKLNSFITTTPELALEQAKDVQAKLDAGEVLPPLAGIPMSLKDNICMDGVRTTAASKMLENFIAPYDAHVVEKLKENNFVMVGKTNLDEFAMGSSTETSYFGKTMNPWNLECVPGGSSGGPAAAVAGNQVAYALGSDTGGSIRIPASFCGIVGFKPSYGAVSRYGCIALSSSLDQIGPMTKDVTDAALVMDTISGYDRRDTTSYKPKMPSFTSALKNDVKGLKIALPKEFIDVDGLDESVKKAVLDAVEVLKKQGAQVDYISLDVNDYAIPCYYIIGCAEAASNLARYDGIRYGYRAENYKNLDDLYKKTRSEGFGYEVKQRIILGTLVVCTDCYDMYFKRALRARTVIINKYNEVFNDYDIIIGPTSPNTAFKFGAKSNNPVEMRLNDIYSSAANLAGLPVISVPCGVHPNGLPIGIQMTGKAFNDHTVLQCAYTYEQNSEWHKLRAKF